MKKYKRLKIRIMSSDEDVLTQSYGEIEQQKSFYDNTHFDISW